MNWFKFLILLDQQSQNFLIKHRSATLPYSPNQVAQFDFFWFSKLKIYLTVKI